ncbi:MAG: hypothetical protein EOM67_08880 [Spirochaetia bacterium]|nr:hypothetical protein [Spirochaetia bacterium]
MRNKIFLLLFLLFSLFPPLFAEGILPFNQQHEKYEDPFYPTSDLTHYIYTAFTTPYSLQWFETYIDSDVRPTFLTYHQDALSLLSTKQIKGVLIDQKESYSIVNVDFDDNTRVSSMWKHLEDGLYVMFSFTT